MSRQYATGSYGHAEYPISAPDSGKISFDFYRAVGAANLAGMTLLPLYDSEYVTGVAPVAGSFGNYGALASIYSFTLEYETSAPARMLFDETLVFGEGSEQNIPAAHGRSEAVYHFSDFLPNYFRIESGASVLTVYKIEILFSGLAGVPATNWLSAGEGCYRIKPTIYNGGTLTSGVTAVDVPISIKVDPAKGTYTVRKTKRYVYYELKFVNASNADLAAQTDPFDVANYVFAFGTWPANYALKNEMNSAKAVFGNKARTVSKWYDSNNGYAQYVPCNSYHYCELDIALSEEYATSRGVGRLVYFPDGFKTCGPDPAAVFTDDHYATFAEYCNDGSFAHRYNAENGDRMSIRANYAYSHPQTLSLAG